MKKASYAPSVIDTRVSPPPQPAPEEEEVDPEMQIFYDSNVAAESIGEHTLTLRVADFEDDA